MTYDVQSAAVKKAVKKTGFGANGGAAGGGVSGEGGLTADAPDTWTYNDAAELMGPGGPEDEDCSELFGGERLSPLFGDGLEPLNKLQVPLFMRPPKKQDGQHMLDEVGN